jgi:hypothetical protein
MKIPPSGGLKSSRMYNRGAMPEMFYYWVQMYYTCPKGHGNRANRYYKAEDIERAKAAAIASDLTCDQCPEGSFLDFWAVSIELRTFPFDDEAHFKAHTPPGAVPQILPLTAN